MPARVNTRAAAAMAEDEVACIVAAWRRARPDLPMDGMGVYLRLHRLHFAFHRAVAALMRGSDVNPGEMFVLMALRRSGPGYTLRPTDLFKTLLVTSAAVTKRVDRLVKLGYVQRVVDVNDRRSWLVRLTKEGRAFADTAISNIALIVSRVVPQTGVRDAERVLLEMERALAALAADNRKTAPRAAMRAPRRRNGEQED
jgi:DNA-binding MarR family transcriptional regulator